MNVYYHCIIRDEDIDMVVHHCLWFNVSRVTKGRVSNIRTNTTDTIATTTTSDTYLVYKCSQRELH